jgi:hypothetical protein
MSMHTRRRLLAGLCCAFLSLVPALVPGPASAAGSRRPAPPANLRVETVSFTWVSLAWDAPAGNPVAYEAKVHTSDNLNSETTIGTTQGFGGLPAGVAHTASVRTIDARGNTSSAVSIQFTTLARTQPPPTTPTNLRAVFRGGVLDSLAWDASDHGSTVSYQLYSGANSVFATWNTAVSIRDLVQYECVESGSTHVFTVQAFGANNYLSGHSAPLTVTIP